MQYAIMHSSLMLLLFTSPHTLEQTPDSTKAVADWLYPKAKMVHSGNAGSISLTVQDTPDSVEKVLNHYGDKLGVQILPSSTPSQNKKDYVPKAGVEYVFYRNNSGAYILTIKTANECLTLVAQRARNATQLTFTHSALSPGK